MSRAQYNAWVADGKPFRLMTPASDLAANLRRHGYTVYGIGNESHLLASPPEDHTPYSATGWPSAAKYGIGYAIDIMPPAKGAKSKLDGKPLPTLQQLGAQLVKDRKANVPGIAWLKYMNWEPERDNGGPCYQESWKPNHARRSSSDRGHIHASGRTGLESSTAARGYDPVARIRGEVGDDMSVRASNIIEGWASGVTTGKGGENVEPVKWRIRDEAYQKATTAAIATVRTELAAMRSVVEALAKTIINAGGSVDTAAILAGVDKAVGQAVKDIQAETRDAVADLAEGGAAQVRADKA